MTLLLVDDSEAERFLLRRALRFVTDDIVIHEAADGRTALDILVRERVDLILLDLRIPGMDGFDILDAIRRESPSGRRTWPIVVMLTSSRLPSDAQRAYDKLANLFVTKPDEYSGYRELAESLLTTLDHATQLGQAAS